MYPSSRDVLNRYYKIHFARKGLRWTPPEREDAEQLHWEEKKILREACKTLIDVSDDLHKFIRETDNYRMLEDIADEFSQNMRKKKFSVALGLMMDELFKEGITWHHIVTFLVYGAEIADRVIRSSTNITNGTSSHGLDNNYNNDDDEEDDDDNEEDESQDDDEESQENGEESGRELSDSSHESLSYGPPSGARRLVNLNQADNAYVSFIIDGIHSYFYQRLDEWIEERGCWSGVKELRELTNNNQPSDKGSRIQGFRRYLGAAAVAVLVGGFYLRSKLIV